MTCVELMYHQPFASPFSSSSVYPHGRGTGGVSSSSSSSLSSFSSSSSSAVRGVSCPTNGFSTGQTLSRMHHEPLNLGHTVSPLSSSLSSSAAQSSSFSSSISSTPLSAPSSYYPNPSFLLTPSSSGPPSGNTLISPSPPLLTSPQQQQPHPTPTASATSPETPSSSPQRHHSSSLLSASSSCSSPPSSSQHLQHQHHHQQPQQNHHHRPYDKDERLSCRQETKINNNGNEPKSAQYLTANCVLFTYDNGSVGEMVDDHFTKALSGSHGDTEAENKQSGSKAPLPMSARHFPPSFWNSSYYQQLQQHHQQQQQQYHNFFGYHRNLHHQASSASSSQHLPYGNSNTSSSSASDMTGLPSTAHYFSPALHGFSNLQSDAWSYSLSNPSTGMSYSHRHMPYDLSSYSSTSRFGQNYNPFLVQPSVVRANPFSGMAGHGSDVTKEHSRTSRFPDHRLGGDYPTHSSFTAIDSLQEATKDLYWF